MLETRFLFVLRFVLVSYVCVFFFEPYTVLEPIVLGVTITMAFKYTPRHPDSVVEMPTAEKIYNFAVWVWRSVSHRIFMWLITADGMLIVRFLAACWIVCGIAVLSRILLLSLFPLAYSWCFSSTVDFGNNYQLAWWVKGTWINYITSLSIAYGYAEQAVIASNADLTTRALISNWLLQYYRGILSYTAEIVWLGNQLECLTTTVTAPQKLFSNTGYSYWMVWLTATLGFVITTSFERAGIDHNVPGILLTTFVLVCASLCFLLRDFLYFFIVFEVSLLPLFFLVSLVGARPERVRAAYFLAVYTLVGSVLLWFAVVFFVEIRVVSEFSEIVLDLPLISSTTRKVLWWAIFLGFAFKVPLVPFHVWLTVAHVEAPTVGSMLLAGLILKLGGFGILRFVLLMFPSESANFKFYVIALCCIGYTFATFAAVRQLDIKRFIAFTSIAHMNFSLGVLFTMQKLGFMAFFHTMISHGFIATGLFFLVGFIYAQTGSRDVLRVRGLARVAPIFSVYWFIFSMGNAGMPLLSGFPGEFFGLTALASVNFFMVFWFAVGFYFTAVYVFVNVTRLLFGTPDPLLNDLRDMDKQTQRNALFLGFFMVVFGVCPDLIFSTVDVSYSNTGGFLNSVPTLGRSGKAAFAATELTHMLGDIYTTSPRAALKEQHRVYSMDWKYGYRPFALIHCHVVPKSYAENLVTPTPSAPSVTLSVPRFKIKKR